MIYRGFKLHIIFVTFAVALAAALGVQQLAYSRQVVQPLERALTALAGVAEVALVDGGDATDVIVAVEPTADLPTVYREAEQLARARLGARLGRVRLADRRSPALTDAYHRLHLSLQEGAATGQFTRMAQQVAALASELPLTGYRLYVDDRHVYALLLDGDAYLVELVARSGPGAGVGGAVR